MSSNEIQVRQADLAPSPERTLVHSLRELYPVSVVRLKENPDFKHVVADSVSMVAQAYGIQYSPEQIAIISVVLMDRGLKIHQVKMAAQYMLKDSEFAEKARYKVPITAVDFITYLTKADPNWEVNKQLEGSQ